MHFDYIVRSCFFGFGIYSFIFILLNFFPLKKNDGLIKIDSAAIRTINYIGIAFIISFIFYYTSVYFGNDSKAKENIINRFFGKYWYALFSQAFLYVFVSQILWIKLFQKNLILRIIVAIISIFDFEKFVIIVTSLHRDYLPSSWTMFSNLSFYGLVIANWIIELLIFFSFVTVIYFIKNRKTI